VPADRLYYLTDANHNVTAVLNASGVVQERYVYDAYGQATIYDAAYGQTRTASGTDLDLLRMNLLHQPHYRCTTELPFQIDKPEQTPQLVNTLYGKSFNYDVAPWSTFDPTTGDPTHYVVDPATGKLNVNPPATEPPASGGEQTDEVTDSMGKYTDVQKDAETDFSHFPVDRMNDLFARGLAQPYSGSKAELYRDSYVSIVDNVGGSVLRYIFKYDDGVRTTSGTYGSYTYYEKPCYKLVTVQTVQSFLESEGGLMPELVHNAIINGRSRASTNLAVEAAVSAKTAESYNNLVIAMDFAVHMIPFLGAADTFYNAKNGSDYVEGCITLVGDLAMLAGVGILGKVGGTAGSALSAVEKGIKMVALPTEAAIGLYRAAQGTKALQNGENAQAAMYFGEAFLRMVGVSVQGLKKIVKSEINFVSSGPKGAIFDNPKTLTSRQRKLLSILSEEGTEAVVGKRGVSMNDLRNLTMHTGDEFAMLTNKGQRMIMRGAGGTIPTLNVNRAKELAAQGWRFSGHTHTPGFQAVSSQGDKAVLQAFGQSRSAVWGAKWGAQPSLFYGNLIDEINARFGL
jgi:YD repeat-containing protein